jgi:diketogulonate reductase-like aldo/keto reductase
VPPSSLVSPALPPPSPLTVPFPPVPVVSRLAGRESEVVAFCNRHGILVEAYAPVGDGDRTHMRDDPVFPPIAAAHGATIGQVILSYDLASGADIVIPRSNTFAHQTENLNLFNVNGGPVMLNQTEIAAIESAHPYAKAYHTDCQPWC